MWGWVSIHRTQTECSAHSSPPRIMAWGLAYLSVARLLRTITVGYGRSRMTVMELHFRFLFLLALRTEDDRGLSIDRKASSGGAGHEGGVMAVRLLVSIVDDDESGTQIATGLGQGVRVCGGSIFVGRRVSCFGSCWQDQMPDPRYGYAWDVWTGSSTRAEVAPARNSDCFYYWSRG